jgi:hypothetical protein
MVRGQIVRLVLISWYAAVNVESELAWR